MNTVVSTEPRIQDVRVTEDEIVAYLADGRVISVPLAWSWGYRRPLPSNAHTFALSAPVKEFIGLTSMRTSVSKVCFTASRRVVRDLRRIRPELCVIGNRRASAFSRRAASVVPKPGVAARAADAQN